VSSEGELEFVRLSDIEHEFAHRRSPCATVFTGEHCCETYR
jgi:hypothetical protein